MSERQLASVQRITEIRQIEGADKIQVAMMNGLGWECVVKKNEFFVGDLVVYIQIDSIVPECDEFEFLRVRKFRVRTIKLKGQVSQGLVVPLSILNGWTQDVSDGYFKTLKVVTDHKEGDDVTDLIGIKKYDPQAQEEQKLATEFKSKSKVLTFCMGFTVFRWIYFKLNHVDKGWPSWGVGKTDEERIQTCAKLFMNNMDKPWYITEKVDGQSATYFYHKSMKWGIPKWIFGVCSRNIWLKKPTNGSYWKVAEKFDLEKKFTALKTELVVQGENLGPSIQKNKYELAEYDLMVFNLKKNGVNYSIAEVEKFCNEQGLKTVPIIHRAFDPKSLGNLPEVKDVVQAIVQMSIGASVLNPKIPREGLVFRLVENPNVSFKIINPEFLLKYENKE